MNNVKTLWINHPSSISHQQRQKCQGNHQKAASYCSECRDGVTSGSHQTISNGRFCKVLENVGHVTEDESYSAMNNNCLTIPDVDHWKTTIRKNYMKHKRLEESWNHHAAGANPTSVDMGQSLGLACQVLTYASSLCDVGRYEEGMLFFQSLTKSAEGSNEWPKAFAHAVWSKYARCMFDAGKLNDALLACRNALSHEQNHPGHVDTTTSVENALLLGQVTFDLGEYSEGIDMIQSILMRSMSHLGPHHRCTCDILVELNQMNLVVTIAKENPGVYRSMVMDQMKHRDLGELVGMVEGSYRNGLVVRLLDCNQQGQFLVDVRQCRAMEPMEDTALEFHVMPYNLVFFKNTNVILHSLMVRQDLNGQKGRIFSFDTTSGRYTIFVQGNFFVVKPDNVMPTSICRKGPCTSPKAENVILSIAKELTTTRLGLL